MEDPARHRPLAEDTKAPCGAITPGAEGLPSSVPDAHLQHIKRNAKAKCKSALEIRVAE
eukprot:COSAG04_NODE_22263_length_358_cov_0.583012_1_plen_58_part_10